MPPDASTSPPAGLSLRGRMLVLAAAFGGWMFAGFQMATLPLINGASGQEFVVPRVEAAGAISAEPAAAVKAAIGKWFGWYNAAFLLGAAAGGLVFGWVGDRVGRVRAMGWSILCYSGLAGATWFAQSAEQLLLLRFLVGLGVGGMWPAGVTLCGEAWSAASRPLLAGLLGTSANVGIFALNSLATVYPVEAGNWRWLLLVDAAPLLLGAAVLLAVPESPAWLASRRQAPAARSSAGLAAVFRPPILRLTLIGICLGTVPLLGGWGVTQWVIPWSDDVHREPTFKAAVAAARSGGAILGALAGGWLANLLGRRTTYFFISLGSLGLSLLLYTRLDPLTSLPPAAWSVLATLTGGLVPEQGSGFWLCVFLLGLVSTVFFGWLPLYLPELFPTAVRATGSGVTFNAGRILTAAGVLANSWLITVFAGDFAAVGTVMSAIYAVGMLVILLAPDTTRAGRQAAA